MAQTRDCSNRSWPGARWWRCDFHLHTPASPDHKERATATEWLVAARDSGLDTVAVTDHNSGQWIDKLRSAAKEVDGAPVIFPGVELTVQSNVHLLVLFDPGDDSQVVTAFLGACGIRPEEHGRQETASSKSLLDALEIASQHRGLAIAPHAEHAKNGFYTVLGPGEQLKEILRSEHLYGVETTPGPSPELLECLQGKREGYERRWPLPRLEFSDAHRLGDIGIRSTWIKMARPSLDGLRLALRDGAFSVRPSSGAATDPNRHGSLVIEKIGIRNTRYIGRQETFELRFNPWLNALIGGRGTGKSSVVEFLRIALRRDHEQDLPKSLWQAFKKLRQVPKGRDDSGLLLSDTEFRLWYRKDDVRYRVQWSEDGHLEPLLEERDGVWKTSEGEEGTIRRRFPVRIYSQKQIFELAEDPEALLRVIDEAPEVDRQRWQEMWDQEESRFLELWAKIRALETRLATKGRLESDVADVRQKLAVFEQADHAETLRRFQERRRQERAVERWLDGLDQPASILRGLADEIEPAELDVSSFDLHDEDDAELALQAANIADRFGEIRDQILKLTAEAERVASNHRSTVGASTWKSACEKASTDYEELRRQLTESGIEDPSGYGPLVQERQRLEEEIRDLRALWRQLEDLRAKAGMRLERLGQHRRQLSKRRNEFLRETLEANPHVSIKIVPYGTRESALAGLRSWLGKDLEFERDLASLMDKLYANHGRRDLRSIETQAAPFEERLAGFKRELRDLRDGEAKPQDQRFAFHLASLSKESFDRLDCWFPPDGLEVHHLEEEKLRPIDQASAGQRSAALLSFLLSHGEEPIVLDQPEDDLDNHLIYSLIVKQLREIKGRRQVVVVTHNPNIVVNGDAELVLPLEVRGGQTRLLGGGSLQEPKVRTEVCRVMEGGREAFERRYQRMLMKEHADAR